MKRVIENIKKYGKIQEIEKRKNEYFSIRWWKRNCRFIGSLFKNENYNVFKFYDAKEAINCIESQKLDFAILDVMIKDVDGFKICKW